MFFFLPEVEQPCVIHSTHLGHLKKNHLLLKVMLFINLLYILETDKKERSHHLPVGVNTKIGLV